MMRPILIFVSFVFLLLTAVNPVPAPASLKGDRVLSLIEKMQAAFKEVKDYTCEVEQVFYEGGRRVNVTGSNIISKEKRGSGSISITPIRRSAFSTTAAKKSLSYRFAPWGS